MSQSKNNELSQSIIAIIAILGVVAAVEIFVLSMMSGGVGSNEVSNMKTDPAVIAERIKPVVTLADIRGGADAKSDAAPVVAEISAKDMYATACAACHDNGVAGAPKPGDKAGWQARLDNGMDSLLASVVNGKGAMPPKGGSAYSDAELTQIIEYILVESDLMTAKAEAPAAEAKTEEMAAPAEMAKEEAPMAKSADVDIAAGEKGYRSACFACHDHGIAGAPKLGDAAGWAGRTDLTAMTNSAINGKGGMPPKGGAAYLSDEEVKNIVGFMLSKI